MQIVKVVARPSIGAKPESAVGGYITLGKFLLGKTPRQIEQALGLQPGYLAAGARIYRFTRLPTVSEYTYELTTQYPDGLAYNAAHSDPRFPPGSRVIHQWKIKRGSEIPVDAANLLDLSPTQVFPYSWLTQK
jgi:hypothetical protein